MSIPLQIETNSAAYPLGNGVQSGMKDYQKRLPAQLSRRPPSYSEAISPPKSWILCPLGLEDDALHCGAPGGGPPPTGLRLGCFGMVPRAGLGGWVRDRRGTGCSRTRPQGSVHAVSRAQLPDPARPSHGVRQTSSKRIESNFGGATDARPGILRV